MKLATAPQSRAAGRILAIASGKGGVGKTTLAIGMARALSMMDEAVLLVDGDLGMANIDVQLGLQPRADISSVLNGKVELKNAVTPVLEGAEQRGGFDVISGRSGSGSLANLSGTGLTKLASGVAALAMSYDRCILDCAAGADRATIRLALTADDVIIVINDEPTSLTCMMTAPRRWWWSTMHRAVRPRTRPSALSRRPANPSSLSRPSSPA